MEFLVLLAVFLCTCAVFLYSGRFLSRPKIPPWLSSLLPAAAPPEPVEKPEADEGEKEEADEDDSSLEDSEHERIFSTFDKDGDGFITADELEESLRRLGFAVTAAETAAMVDRVDANGDGLIDLQEFRQLCDEMMLPGEGEAVAGEVDQNLREAFRVFDGNGDGLITAEELAMALTSLGMKQGAKVEDCREMIKRVDRDGDGKVDFGEFTKMMKMKGGKKLF